ncbi:MAG: hypothetical protein QOI29_2825 [Mycobacterium sp.]|jgi:hypothetical protein|nr:hypothetical protein [Mycobacterium sp.]
MLGLAGRTVLAIDRGQTTRSQAVRGAILNRSEMHRVQAPGSGGHSDVIGVEE